MNRQQRRRFVQGKLDRIDTRQRELDAIERLHQTNPREAEARLLAYVRKYHPEKLGRTGL